VADAEDAFDTADHAADRRADRTGNAVAFMKSMRRAAGRALRPRRQRKRRCCEMSLLHPQIVYFRVNYLELWSTYG